MKVENCIKLYIRSVSCRQPYNVERQLPSRVQRHLSVVVWIVMFSLAPVQGSFVTNASVQSIAMMLNQLCSMVLQLNQVPEKLEEIKIVYYSPVSQQRHVMQRLSCVKSQGHNTNYNYYKSSQTVNSVSMRLIDLRCRNSECNYCYYNYDGQWPVRRD